MPDPRSPPRVPSEDPASVESDSEEDEVSLNEPGCKDVKRGDKCHTDVVWAMKKYKDHPEWYVNISARSTFKDYQYFFHQQVENDGTRRCPRPCKYKPHSPKSDMDDKDKKTKEKKCHTSQPGEDCYNHVLYTGKEAAKYPDFYSGLNGDSTHEEIQHYLHMENECPEPCSDANRTNSSLNTTECHSARPGESCFSDILFAKTKFIEKKPGWYSGSGLTKESSNDDFQAYLHNQKQVDEEAGKQQCPAPCNRKAEVQAELLKICETARSGECYDSVVYGATKGIIEHPEWYKGLTPKSSFEDFQLHIYTGPKSKCKKPPCPCHNSVKGDDCHSSIEWVRNVGVKKFPKDFEGFSKDSDDLEIQRLLHERRMEPCPRPCVPTPW